MNSLFCSCPTLDCSLEMPKDELPNHNCIKHLRSVVQQQQTRIAELEKTSAEHKHQLAEQVGQ